MVSLWARVQTGVPVPCRMGDVTLNNCERSVGRVPAQILNVVGRSSGADCLNMEFFLTFLLVEPARDSLSHQTVVQPALAGSQSYCTHPKSATTGRVRHPVARLRI